MSDVRVESGVEAMLEKERQLKVQVTMCPVYVSGTGGSRNRRALAARQSVVLASLGRRVARTAEMRCHMKAERTSLVDMKGTGVQS